MTSSCTNSYEQDTCDKCRKKTDKQRICQLGMRSNGDYITPGGYSTELAAEYCNFHPHPLTYGTRVPGAPQN